MKAQKVWFENGRIYLLTGDGREGSLPITTIVSIIAMLLMVNAYMEQWILWILVNLVSVFIWLQFTIAHEPHAALMLIMWLFYTANSINGYRVWLKLSK